MKKFTLALAAFLLVSTVTAFGVVTSYSPPVGAVTKTAAANTDTIVSVTLAQPAAWIGTVAASTGGTPTGTITAAASPNWSANAYAQASAMYYVRMLSGALRGHYFVITANDTQTLTVDTAGLDLTTLAVGDAMEVVPFWTLGTLYPAGLSGIAFTPSVTSKQTELLFFDATTTGINRSASAVYFFATVSGVGAWRKVGQSTSLSFNSTIIYPDSYFIQRNTTASTSLVYTGRVQPGYLGTILEANAAQNDNFVALSFPVDVTLNGSGLATSAFTPSVSSYKDLLLWFDPAGTGINRSATYTFYYATVNGVAAWRQKGLPNTTDVGSTVLKAGSGFIIRKAAGGTNASWVFPTGI